MEYIKNDNFICVMKGSPGYSDSNCYVTLTYNKSRSGNTMRYTGTLSLRMGSRGSFSFYRWKVSLRAGGTYVLNNYEIKGNHGNSNRYPGTRYFSANFSFNINTNTSNTPLVLDWWSENENYTWMSTYVSNYLLGYMTPITPSAPSVPGSVSIPSAIAPDKVANISWSGSSGGTNGVSGYEWVFSRDGGTSWNGFNTYISGTSTKLNLGTNGFVQNSRLRVAVRSYSTVNGEKYKSGWRYSSTTTTVFVAPSVPLGLTLTYNTEEPIPTAVYSGKWKKPTDLGTNGVSGYTIMWLKNGAQFKADLDVGNSTLNSLSIVEGDYAVGDKISFKVRAYTIGQGVKYYSKYTNSVSITIVSDKYIFISINGGEFIKRKMYISVNGGEFTEVKKNKFNIIGG